MPLRPYASQPPRRAWDRAFALPCGRLENAGVGRRGRWYLTGVPGPRSWYANVRANPRLIVHLKHGVTADLPATEVPGAEATRRRVITAVLDLQNLPEIAARVSQRQHLDDWLAGSPLVEIPVEDDKINPLQELQNSPTLGLARVA